MKNVAAISFPCSLVLLFLARHSEAQVCYADTQGSGAMNKKCGFPFTWNGRTYNTCTTANNGNTPWCYHVNRSSWGHCQNTPACLTGNTPANPPSVVNPPPSVNPPAFVPTPPPTRGAPSPTAKPTKSPTKPPTIGPTRTPTVAPKTSPPTGKPSVQPTPAPTPATPKPQGELMSVQLSPFTIAIRLDTRRRRLTQDQTNSLFEILYNYLLPHYESALSQPVASLELTILDQENGEDNEGVLSRLVLGTAYFISQPPSQSQVDEATRDALTSRDFLQSLQDSNDPVLSQAGDVNVVTGYIEDSSTKENSGGGDSGNTGLFVFSILAAIFCGIGAVAIFAYVYRLNRRNSKQQDMEESVEIEHDADMKMPDTPSTMASEPRESNVPQEDASVMSYLREDASALGGGASVMDSVAASSNAGEKSYGFPDEEMW